MSTRTNTSKISTTNNRGRGRGRGRGRQSYHNSNTTQPNAYYDNKEESYPYDERRRGPGRFQSTNRGRVSFRGKSDGNMRSNRSDISVRSSSPDSNSSIIPRHAQNPFFVGELLSRFNNMLPTPSFLEDEVVDVQQPKVKANRNPAPNRPTYAVNTCRDNTNPINSTHGSSPIYSPFNHTGNARHQNNRFDDGRNRNKKGNQVKQMNENDESLFLPKHLADYSLDGRGGLKNVRGNLPVDNSDRKRNLNYQREQISDYYHTRDPTPPYDSVTSVPVQKDDLDKRRTIMKNYGFNVDSNDHSSDGTQDKISNSYQIPHSLHHNFVSARTSPRVRHNLEFEPGENISVQSEMENTTLKPHHRHSLNSSMMGRERSDGLGSDQDFNPSPGTSSNGNMDHAQENSENETQPLAISGQFFSKLDAMINIANGRGNVKQSADRIISVGKNKNRQETKKNKPPTGSASQFNPFIKTGQIATSQDQRDGSSLPKQRKQRYEPNDYDPPVLLELPQPRRLMDSYDPALVQLPPYPHRLMERDIAGTSFNVHRPARDGNERVPTRREALERIQEQYEIQRSEFEAKKREKEAKKREEYLAKYKHVDQGYRLNDNLLDEAAGYAPDYVETVEEIRERQQQQLRRDALVYQERQREEEERQRRKEEQKSKEKLEKAKHVDAGYRLGHGDNRGQEVLMEGETEQEAIQRQEEQLILEMLIQDQMKSQTWTKPETEGGSAKEVEGNQVNQQTNSASMNPFLSSRQNPKTQGPPSEIAPKQMNHVGKSLGAVPKKPVQKHTKADERDEQATSIERNVQNAVNPPIDPEPDRTERLGQSPQLLKQLNLKLLRNSMTQISDASRPSRTTAPLLKTPASCTLKNQNGAVLVLRPTPEDLNRALAKRLEVQDEADKFGFSMNYKPNVEQVPLYCNNRFERKPVVDIDNPCTSTTGAIPKTSSSADNTKPSVAAKTDESLESVQPEKPAFDHKAELMAARQRFQQKYEEALKKMKEQKDDS